MSHWRGNGGGRGAAAPPNFRHEGQGGQLLLHTLNCSLHVSLGSWRCRSRQYLSKISDSKKCLHKFKISQRKEKTQIIYTFNYRDPSYLYIFVMSSATAWCFWTEYEVGCKEIDKFIQSVLSNL